MMMMMMAHRISSVWMWVGGLNQSIVSLTLILRPKTKKANQQLLFRGCCRQFRYHGIDKLFVFAFRALADVPMTRHISISPSSPRAVWYWYLALGTGTPLVLVQHSTSMYHLLCLFVNCPRVRPAA